jgi:hypothetical protein
MLSDSQVSAAARRLAAVLEPVVGQVYFSPECHEEYSRLGFGGSPASARGVAMPDGAAYFTSRGSCMGQVAGEVVAAAFAVFNPAAVVPSVTYGWSLTDAPTIAAARTRGATAQLTRIVGETPDGLAKATELLTRATEGLRPEGRPLFAGLLALGLPGDPIGDMWRLGDLLREYRGDSHTGAWISAGLDATEIGLLTELYLGLELRTYIRSRAWSNEQLDAAEERLQTRGLVADGAFTDDGRALRETVEVATDRQLRPVVDSLGDDIDELISMLRPWGDAIRAAGGYLMGGAADLAPRSAP